MLFRSPCPGCGGEGRFEPEDPTSPIDGPICDDCHGEGTTEAKLLILPTQYVVVVDYLDLGPQGITYSDEDDAFDNFTKAVNEGYPVRVFRWGFDPDTNDTEVIRDVTEDYYDLRAA